MDGYAERASRLYSPLQASCTDGARFGGSVRPPLHMERRGGVRWDAPPSCIAQGDRWAPYGDGHLRKGMRLAPRPRQQQSVLIGRPEKTHPLHFPIADESKRELRACPRRPRPRTTSSFAGTIPDPRRDAWLAQLGIECQRTLSSVKAVAELGPSWSTTFSGTVPFALINTPLS